MRSLWIFAFGFALFLGSLGVGPNPALAAPGETYGAAFHARFDPKLGVVEACITIDQDGGELLVLNLAAPGVRFSGFVGDGEVERNGERLRWRVPRQGGALCYRVVVDHQRNGTFDARLTERWAIVRLGDVFPPARARSKVGAASVSTVVLDGPEGWSFETRYGPADQPRLVVNPHRRFDRPTGWAIAGELGIRREQIAGRRIAVAAPSTQQDSRLRRLDTLAFLRWTLPTLVEVFPGFPDRLLIVGASDAMWRGGLSAPGSLYIHAGRPLISENGTSSLLHELVHVATVAPSTAARDDWVVEGLAEYYSLETLRRSGGISQRRFDGTIDKLAAWAKRENGGPAEPSTGADTAWAVLKLRALAHELADSGANLDVVVRRLVEHQTLSRSALVEQADKALGRASRTLADAAE